MAKVFLISQGDSDSQNEIFRSAALTVFNGNSAVFSSFGTPTLAVTDREALELLHEALEDGFLVEIG